MKPEDLNLKASDLPEDYYLGHVRLYPWAWHKAFSKLEGQARNWLDAHSYPYFIDGVGTIPKRNLAKVIAKIEDFNQEMQELAGEFIKLVPDFKGQWEKKYPAI